MIEAGWGRVENRLISTYINSVDRDQKQIYAELYLPHYGITMGEPYRMRLHHYLHYQRYPLTSELEHDYLHGEPEPFDCQDDTRSPFLQDYTDSVFFNALMEECEKEEKAINHPGATPFRN
jgi:hypothetical protein